MITKQCDNCAPKGKNYYCNACDKKAELFYIYSYYTNRFSENTLMGRIKAFTWHDVLEYVKNNFFHYPSGELDINCEKNFAYIEEKLSHNCHITEALNKSDSNHPTGYKIYLNKDNESIDDTPKGDFWDLTST
ncbi:MAG: hypothetical protein WCD19_00935 [Nitrososphaeraceae archaeon]